MKRILLFLSLMLLPLSAMAMAPVSDSTLSDVTGQAGVNINADLTMNISIGTMAWGDSDGIRGGTNPWTNVTSGGYIGVTGFNISNLHIRARTDTADNWNGYSTLMLKPITIDVATGDKSGRGGSANTTFVRFGLGALEISMDSIQFDIALGARPNGNPTAAGANLVLDQEMGRVYMGPMHIYINPWSYVDIYAHNGCGVTFDIDVTIDNFELPYIVWEDRDGLAGPSGQWMTDYSSGFVGLDYLQIGGFTDYPAITINGAVSIDVVTSSAGTYTYIDSLMTMLNSGAPYIDITNQGQLADLYALIESSGTDLNNGSMIAAFLNGYCMGRYGVNPHLVYSSTPITVIRFSFPTDFNFNLSRITGRVVLGHTTTTGVLGDIYLEKVFFNIRQGSWVDVWAH